MNKLDWIIFYTTITFIMTAFFIIIIGSCFQNQILCKITVVTLISELMLSLSYCIVKDLNSMDSIFEDEDEKYKNFCIAKSYQTETKKSEKKYCYIIDQETDQKK